jgi:hypothetical protein
MKIRTGAGLAAMMILMACARGEDARPLENAAVADNAADDGIDDADPAGNATAAGLPTDAWVGKWIGVEGLVLDIQPAGERGHYMLSVTLLDGTKSYEGTAEGDMIRFTRNGRPESIRAATGDQTGLKWLAGKTNCLMIQQGEGFCRDEAGAKPAGDPVAQNAAEPAAPPAGKP